MGNFVALLANVGGSVWQRQIHQPTIPQCCSADEKEFYNTAIYYKPFSLSLTARQNKLERFTQESFFYLALIFTSKARAFSISRLNLQQLD
jgi:hypothetical protein